MGAKDTIINAKQYEKIEHRGTQPYYGFISPYLEAQTEITWSIAFKEGQEEEYKKWVKACMQAGMLISEPEQLVNLYKAGQKVVITNEDGTA